jgi:voltage-gated potassium channel
LYRFDLVRILIILVVVWLMGASAMYLIEGAKNSNFRSFGRSALAILHYLFSGLEAKYPITVAGNVVSILILTLGAAIVTVFTATLVKLLVERALNVRHLRLKPSFRFRLEGHTLLVGWSKRSERIIRQLRSEDLRFRDPIVVVTDHRAETQLGNPRDLRNLWQVEGDAAKEETLRRCDVTSARTALVLPEPTSNGDENLSCLAAALAIDRLAPQVHTVVEARTPAILEHLAACRADEVINTALLADRLLSQALITPGVVRIYDELLSFGRDSQEIYAVEVPAELDRKTFQEVAWALRGAEVVPLGFQASDMQKPRLNPFGGTRYGFRGGPEYKLRTGKGDRILLMADERWVLQRHFRTAPWRRLNPWSRRTSMDESPEAQKLPHLEAQSPHPILERRIAFCGWNDQAPDVIHQLQEQVVEARQRFHIRVVTERLTDDSISKKRVDVYKNVSFVFGDPTRQEVLANAGLAEVDSALILAEGLNGEDHRRADHRSLMVALAARAVDENLHLVAQVLESQHQEHFRRIPNLEIVSLEDLAEKLLAQAAISPGISAVYDNLLTATSDTNEIYLVAVPEPWLGCSFQQLYEKLLQDREEVILLGYATPSEPGAERVVVLNPRQHRRQRHGVVDWRGYELQPGDRLVALAYEQPDW